MSNKQKIKLRIINAAVGEYSTLATEQTHLEFAVEGVILTLENGLLTVRKVIPWTSLELSKFPIVRDTMQRMSVDMAEANTKENLDRLAEIQKQEGGA